MAEQQNALVGSEHPESLVHFGQVCGAQAFPFAKFPGLDVRFKHWKRHEGRSHTQDHITADRELPEWTQSQVLSRSPPACQAHSTACSKHTHLAQFHDRPG